MCRTKQRTNNKEKKTVNGKRDQNEKERSTQKRNGWVGLQIRGCNGATREDSMRPSKIRQLREKIKNRKTEKKKKPKEQKQQREKASEQQ